MAQDGSARRGRPAGLSRGNSRRPSPSFSHQTQQEFGQYRQPITGGDKSRALARYGADVQCWMSYNARRAINMGYRNTLWYRGGMEAWQAAGLPTRAQGGTGRGPGGRGDRGNGR